MALFFINLSMPSGVFKPYSGVSTGILIFTKTNHQDTDKVWFYNMEQDGYDLSINKYKEVEYIPVEYPPAQDILKDLQTIEKEISSGLSDLERMI